MRMSQPAHTSCEAVNAEGHATFIDSGWVGLGTAITGRRSAEAMMACERQVTLLQTRDDRCRQQSPIGVSQFAGPHVVG